VQRTSCVILRSCFKLILLTFEGVSLFQVGIKIFYGRRQVSRRTINLQRGCCFFHDPGLPGCRPPNRNVLASKLPTYRGHSNQVKRALARMDQGFVLKIEKNRVLCLTRWCRSEILYSKAASSENDSPAALEKYQEVNLFSYDDFVKELANQDPGSIPSRRNKPEISLFFGSKPCSPTDCFVSVKIQPLGAQKIHDELCGRKPLTTLRQDQ